MCVNILITLGKKKKLPSVCEGKKKKNGLQPSFFPASPCPSLPLLDRTPFGLDYQCSWVDIFHLWRQCLFMGWVPLWDKCHVSSSSSHRCHVPLHLMNRGTVFLTRKHGATALFPFQQHMRSFRIRVSWFFFVEGICLGLCVRKCLPSWSQLFVASQPILDCIFWTQPILDWGT